MSFGQEHFPQPARGPEDERGSERPLLPNDTPLERIPYASGRVLDYFKAKECRTFADVLRFVREQKDELHLLGERSGTLRDIRRMLKDIREKYSYEPDDDLV